MKNPIHIIVISSVRPEPTSAGQIILHRHLVDQPGITLEVYGSEPKRPTLSKLVRRIAGRLGQTRLHRFVNDFWVLWGGRWIDPELPTTVTHPERTIVLTVAHGDGFMAAHRFAKRHQLPLVAWFQDWWPDMADAHQPVRAMLERKYRNLYATADLAICVCDGMKDALGDNPKAIVLHDLPAKVQAMEAPPRPPDAPFKIIYFGNLTDYGPMLGDALEESLKHPEILLQVRGSNPAWSEERKSKMRANGRWLDFASRAELDAWLASADAFLVPMVFDPEMRRRMETSFPSKLVEFAQFGKPIVVWGPEYCSAVRWARGKGEDEDKARLVTQPNSSKLLACLIDMLRDGPAKNLSAIRMKQVAEHEFSPERIRMALTGALSFSVRD